MALPVIEWDTRSDTSRRATAGRKGAMVRKLWQRLTAFLDLLARGRYERRVIREAFEVRLRQERMAMFRAHAWYPPG